MAYLFDIFHNFLHSDTVAEIRQDFTPNEDCFNLIVVKGITNQKGVTVQNNCSYPVHNNDLILIETSSDSVKQHLCSMLRIKPDSVVSFFRKQKGDNALYYLLVRSKLSRHSETRKIFYLHDRMLSDASQKIIKTIDRELFEFQTREQAEFYVHKIELAIANYVTTIKSQFSNNPEEMSTFSDDLKQDLLKLYFRYLEIIQSHIEITYAVYRDQNKMVTGNTQAILATELLQRQSSIRIHLQENGINDTLSKIILRPLNLISEKGDCQEMSQQRLNYLMRYAEELDKFFNAFDQVDEHQLIQYLYILNFNNIALLSYIGEDYLRMKHEINDERSLLEYLNTRIHQLNHLPPSILKPYNADLRDLRKQAQVWIEEEIEYLKKSIAQKEKEHNHQLHSHKLKFNYSVEVITGLFKLLHDAGITDSGANKTIRWINQSISSKNQPHISQQSIQRKFFDKYTNKEPLKNIVIHLLNHLNKT